mmetsp:Transcript_25591/g.41501  ORF Transcript_25591/g.41501 Transcript_25591/m.41501 type:complete len:206 (-) Transcript_25591:688-1305(-)
MVMVRNPGSETKQSPFKNLCQKNAKFSHPPGIGAVRILRSVKSTISISSPSIWKTLLSRTSKSMRYVLNSSRSHVRCTVRGTQGCHSPFTFTMSFTSHGTSASPMSPESPESKRSHRKRFVRRRFLALTKRCAARQAWPDVVTTSEQINDWLELLQDPAATPMDRKDSKKVSIPGITCCPGRVQSAHATELLKPMRVRRSVSMAR